MSKIEKAKETLKQVEAELENAKQQLPLFGDGDIVKRAAVQHLTRKKQRAARRLAKLQEQEAATAKWREG